jgi:hypothetical protein
LTYGPDQIESDKEGTEDFLEKDEATTALRILTILLKSANLTLPGFFTDEAAIRRYN